MFVRTSLTARVGALCAISVSLAIILMGSAILWLFTQSSERIVDNHLMAYADLIVSQVEFRNDVVAMRGNGKLLAEIPRYWQISEGGKPLFRSANLATWIPTAPDDVMRPQRMEWRSEEGRDIVAVQATFLFPHNRRITLISGLDASIAEAYKAQEREQLAMPLYRVLLGGGAALILIYLLLSRYMLRPILTIKGALQSIRLGKATRIEGDYPAEIKALTDEINHLLEYTSGSIARYREFSSNLAHTLKTPLTVIANEPDIKIIKSKLRGLMEVVDRSLARVHAAATSNVLFPATPIAPVLRDISESFGKVFHRRVEFEFPEDVAFKGDRADLYEILGNIIENACKFSHSLIRMAYIDGAIAIEDDGPGIPEGRRMQVLRRGTKLNEAKPGSGIGLAIAGDLIALYGGRIRLESSPLGGLKVLIFLPVDR